MTPALARTPSIGRRTLLAILAGAGTVGRRGRLQAGDRMEDPASWDRLTASLSTVDLGDPHWGWAFLTVQRLVRDAPPDRDQFMRLLAAEQGRRVPPGPSLALRLAGALRAAGLTTSIADIPDPHGTVAGERYQLVQSWSYTP